MIPMKIGLWSCTTLLLLGTGCTVNVGERGGPLQRPGELIELTETVELTRAEMVQVELSMGAGELLVEGGAADAKLMEGDFDYNIESWKPEIRYEEAGFRGRLTVKQGSGSATMGKAKNRWDIRLSNQPPMDLEVRCGAGESKLDLRGLNLRSVNVKMGAGRVEIDLRSEHHRDFEVNVEGGVGEATIRLPKVLPVEASAKGGLGNINVTGLVKDGDGYWVSEAKGRDKAGIRLNVKGGIGEINIHAE
jgi:hypothetical protein